VSESHEWRLHTATVSVSALGDGGNGQPSIRVCASSGGESTDYALSPHTVRVYPSKHRAA